MESALVLNEQSYQKQKPQEYVFPLSPPASPQQLTLEDISPIWASRLKKENIPTYLSLTWLRWRYELQKSSKCVVGEAYNYSSQYTDDCYECDRIGCRFLNCFMLNWRKKLELNKRDFVKHWNAEHSKSGGLRDLPGFLSSSMTGNDQHRPLKYY
jgi:hypothetical protein